VVAVVAVVVLVVVAVVVVAVDVRNAVRAKLPAAKERAMGNMQGPQKGWGQERQKRNTDHHP